MSQNEPAPSSRAYVHDRCEQPTVVSDTAFSTVASPLAGVEQTYCNACKDMFAVKEYRWADSGETLPDYYQRHAGGATAIDRFIASRHSIIAAFVVSVVVGIATAALFYFFLKEGLMAAVFLGIGAGFLSLIAMGTILISFLTPMVHRRVCKVSDPRHLV
ncbi:hypothetical protein LOC71_02185 [Rhodopirellula sp. JC740]|uniref:Uncharacterized protein n=1 Tax=Rhodopirellula halodulae TaxID=2894198 RepID=A0ABS8NBX2_9BACT|nr:hypothetical protein [Rhodopirellula sp. JC740]MCC9641065.1 hypothetical protein [Rhodopirellula sp. JC740]